MQQKVRVWVSVSVALVVLIVLLNLAGRNNAVAQERSRSLKDDMLKTLTNLHNDHLCKVKQGYKFTYLDVLNVCMSCARICDETQPHMKEVCAFGCQQYSILQSVKDMIHDNVKAENTQEPKEKGLISRITELESISTKFRVLEDLKNRMDGISETLSSKEAALKKEVTRVENDQGNMIEELQDAMDAVERQQRFLFAGLSVGCFLMIAILAVAFYMLKSTNSHHLIYKTGKHQP